MCLKKLFQKIKKIVLKKNLISKINEKIKKLFSKIVQYQINPYLAWWVPFIQDMWGKLQSFVGDM